MALKPDQRPPPSHTGTMRRDPDGVIRGQLLDLFNWSIEFEATKEGSEYYIRGWRGRPPEFLRVPLIDDDVKPAGDQ